MTTDEVMLPCKAYEGAGGWKDGRLGQAFDLVFAVLKERDGADAFRDPLLLEIERLDEGRWS